MIPFQRLRLRATSARACSRPNSVFFEAQPFAPQKVPYRIMGHTNTTHRQQIFEAMKRQMRCAGNLVDDKITMRLKNTLAMAPDFIWGDTAG
jgi:hypothetical protein